VTGRHVEIENGSGLLAQVHGEWVAGDAASSISTLMLSRT
jgi:hypothetical protein